MQACEQLSKPAVYFSNECVRKKEFPRASRPKRSGPKSNRSFTHSRGHSLPRELTWTIASSFSFCFLLSWQNILLIGVQIACFIIDRAAVSLSPIPYLLPQLIASDAKG